MIVTRSEKLVYVDVDETLIMRSSTGIKLDYYGMEWTISPIMENINFMISLKERGYYVIVHSANGWLHAKKVIELLYLVDFVDEIKSKPIKYVDDKPVEEWFGPRIYFK